jgi:hypothetical protein
MTVPYFLTQEEKVKFCSSTSTLFPSVANESQPAAPLLCFGQVLALHGTWLAAPLCYEIINNSVILERMFPDRPQDSVGFNSTILISYLIPQAVRYYQHS